MGLWHHEQDDLPKVLRDMARERKAEGNGGAWAFALLCGAVGLAILLSACSASVQVTGIGATLALDPGKMAPMMAPIPKEGMRR